MRSKISIVTLALAALLATAGLAGAQAEQLQRWLNPQPTAGVPTFTVATAPQATTEIITYQGRLTNSGGSPLNGSYTMRFIIYDASVAGTALFDSGDTSVTVSNGLFKVNLGVDTADFDGQALWLSLIVSGETLSPRQPLTAVPYALSLRPGAEINSATGFALLGSADTGTGLYATSTDSYALHAASSNSTGGYITSSSGNGLVVETSGTDHFDAAIIANSTGGYALLAQSENNMAVRGEAGNISGAATPLGRVGVAGMGQNRGLHGASSAGLGVYGTSVSSTGIFGNTTRSDQNYGLYTNDNLFSSNINFNGSLMQVMRNASGSELHPGDVVAISGLDTSRSANSPTVLVTQATAENAQAVAGVVYGRFNVEFGELVEQGVENLPEVTPAGPAADGEYILVVVYGPAQVNIASGTELATGELLSAAAESGLAGSAPQLELSGGMTTAVPGTVLGKALETPTTRSTQIWVYVTLK